MQAWDNARLLDRQQHRPSRRRWSSALRERTEYCSNWSRNLIRVEATTKHTRTRKLTKKDIEDTQKLLQLQTENFVRSLEMQSLRNDVSHLLEARSRAEEGLRAFQNELKGLQREVLANDKSITLDYTLSEQDWLDIVER